MIDLRFANLPAYIEVGGEIFAIKTGFREWIAWLEELEVDGIADYGIFADTSNIPSGDEWVEVALEFAKCKPTTPTGSEQTTVQAFDFVRDGDYIVGAFQQAYGIDLTDPNLSMHWHRFLALFRSLPNDCMMSQIMAYRTFRESNKDDYNKSMKRARYAYTLPQKDKALTEQQQKEREAYLDWADWAFGKVTVD